MARPSIWDKGERVSNPMKPLVSPLTRDRAVYEVLYLSGSSKDSMGSILKRVAAACGVSPKTLGTWMRKARRGEL